MANVRAMLVQQGLSTINLGTPLNESFSVTILGITYHGQIVLSDVHIDGIATLHRTGVAELTPEVIVVHYPPNEIKIHSRNPIRAENIFPSPMETL